MNKKVAIVIYRPKPDTPKVDTFIKFHKQRLASLVLYSDEFPIPLRAQTNNRSYLVKQVLYILRFIRLFSIIRTKSIDIVLAEYGTIGAEIHHFTKRINMPLAVEFRGFDASIKRILKEYAEKYKSMFEYASFCVAKSKRMKKALMELGCPEEKIKVIPSGFNPNAFNKNVFSDKSKNFVFVGRLIEVKGPFFVIKAFAEVNKEISDCKLTMIGDGPLMDECISLVKELNIEDVVDFVGIIDQEQIINYFSSSIALINHSITASDGAYEGMPNVLLEANASGLPVIATNSGGIVDTIVHGMNGFLVSEKDYQNQAKYMIELLKDPSKALKLGSAGRRFVMNKLTNEASLNKLISEINKV